MIIPSAEILSSSWTFSGGTSSSLLLVVFVCGFYPGMSATPDLKVTFDASGSLRFAAFVQGAWFNWSWVSSQGSQSIAYKELFPMVLAARIWGPQWSRRHVMFRCHNKTVVHILNSRTSKIPCLKRLLRHLLASAAVLISPLPLIISQVSLIVLLTPCPAFFGRSSSGLLPKLGCSQCLFCISFWRNRLLRLRTAVPSVPGLWLGRFYL